MRGPEDREEALPCQSQTEHRPPRRCVRFGSVEGLGLLWAGTGDAMNQQGCGALRVGALAQPVPNHGAQALAAEAGRVLYVMLEKKRQPIIR
jgi:hypothetical protein